MLSDRILDFGVNELYANGNRLDLCTQEPTTYAEATSTYTKANKTSLSIGAPGDRTGGGRKVTIAQILDGSVTGTGQVTHYSITDTVNERLLATEAIDTARDVVSGDTFKMAAFDIGIPDPA